MTRSALVKAAGTVALLTVLSNLLGFLREASLAAVFGATAATDAYLMAQTLPYLLFSTVSYALTTTFIPIYLQVREEQGTEEAYHFANRVLWAVLCVACVFVLLGEILAEPLVRVVAPGFQGTIADLTTSLSRIMFPMMIFQLTSGILAGILQADGRFAIATAANLVQNISIIVSIVVFGPRFGVASVATGTLLGSFLAMCVKIPSLSKLGFRFHATFNFNDPALRRMVILMLPAVLGASATQLNTLVDRVLASGLPPGRVAALNYAYRLMSLAPQIIGASILTVVYPTLAKMAARRNWRGLSERLVESLKLLHFLLAPVAVGVLVLREPFVRVVFERGVFDSTATQETARALLFLSLGIGILPMRDLVSRAFFALQDTRTPVVVGLITVGINIALNLLLVGPLEQGGLALAFTMATLFGLLLALWMFNRRTLVSFRWTNLLTSVMRTQFASIVMGGVVWFAYSRTSGAVDTSGPLVESAYLMSIGGLGAIVYFLTASLLRVPEIVFVRELLQRGMIRLAQIRARVERGSEK